MTADEEGLLSTRTGPSCVQRPRAHATRTCCLPLRSSQPPGARPKCAVCQVGGLRLGEEPGRGQRGLPGGGIKLALPGEGAGGKGNSQRDSMGEGTKWEGEGTG